MRTRFGVRPAESSTHVLPDLKSLRTDGRAQPGHHGAGRDRHGLYGGLKDAAGQSTPPGMGSRNHRAAFLAKQDREAIGRQNCANRP